MNSHFENLSDEAITTMVRESFNLILNNSVLTPKAANEPEPEVRMGGFGFIQLLRFARSFEVAESRGLLNKIELAQGRQIMAIINGG